MAEVHYRILHYRRGGALGDRLVLGLVHWDGATLRSAFKEGRVSASGLSGDDSAVRGAVRAFRALADECAPADDEPTSLLSLEDLFRVPSGVGSALAWSPMKFAEPSRPEAHFESLCALHRLTKSEKVEQDRLTRQRLAEGLRTLGERLRDEHGYGPDKLRVGEAPAGGRLSYTPPLSWKNGVWHHAVPVSFDTSADERMTERAFAASGVLVQGITPSELPVVVLAMPPSPEKLKAAQRYRDVLADVREDAIFIEVGSGSAHPFAALEEKIVQDIRAAH